MSAESLASVFMSDLTCGGAASSEAEAASTTARTASCMTAEAVAPVDPYE